MGIISAIFPSHLWLRLCQAGIALALIFKLISVLRPEEVVLDAEETEKVSH